MLQRTIAAESHAESHATLDSDGDEGAKTGPIERESGSGGRTRTYDQAVNSRPLYH